MLVRRTNKGGHTSGTASAENSRTVAHVLMVPIVVRRWPGLSLSLSGIICSGNV